MATISGAKKAATAAKKAAAASAKKAVTASAAAEESRSSQESLRVKTIELPPPPLQPSSAAVRTRLHVGFQALSVSGPVRRTQSPGCPMAPPRLRCVQNNKHPCKPKPVCHSISSAFLPRAGAAEFKTNVICLSYVRYMFSCHTCHMSGIYLARVNIIFGNMTS